MVELALNHTVQGLLDLIFKAKPRRSGIGVYPDLSGLCYNKLCHYLFFNKMKILLHLCCAHCTPCPLKVLSEEGHQISGFWYNPNIHPFTEYQNRLNALKTFESLKSFPVFYNDSYDLEKYLKAVINDVGNRCSYCYKIRLIKTANWAIQQGFDGFSTTLLVSPYQKHELIKEIGEKIGKDLGIEFVYRDFRPGFYEGKNEAKKLDLYSQKYCGCIFSEKERYLKKSKVENFKKSFSDASGIV